jgi:polyketide synthase PksN
VNASVIFLAVFQVLLYRYTGQDDIIVGMPTLGRPRERFDALVGYFINMVAIRSQGAGGRPCTDFIRDLQLTMVDALDHAVYPFPRLVRELNVPRLLSHSPVFQAVFLYQNFLDGIYQEGEYELELEVWEREAGFIVHFKYNPDLYEPATVSRMMEHLLNLAGEICSHPGWTADQFCFITAEEQKLLSDWNETGVAYPQDRCIHELFEERARRTPDAVAVIDAAAEPLTYGELDVKSTALAVYLQRQGVGPDCPVGICMERGYEMLIGILGILKAGGAYVPLDPDYPAERLGFICRDSRLKLILTRTGLMTETLPLLEETVQVIDPDHDWAEIAATASGRDILKREVRSVHLAYVIYTSGSTGNPKGVMVSHGNALNTLFFLESKYPVTDADSYLLKTNYTFDVSLAELFGWFIGNGRLVILPPHEEKAPETLAAFITQYRVTHINFVPSMLSVFLNDVAGRKDFLENCPLKYLMVAGEAFPVELVKQAVAVFKDARVENIYGPTEAAIYAAWFSCSGIRIVSPNTPIGKPLANTRLYIVDSGLRPTPVGVPGELCIAGAGVARGYLNQPELSAAKFIANPFGPDVKLYKTGDLARWLPDGNIEYLGRIDHQVKIRGFRIELGEIESRLLGYPEIQNSAVVVREQDQNKQLIAYYTRRRAEPKTPEAASREAQKIKEYLRSQLPEYMIPAFFVPLAAMPLTASGKINRKELTERPVSLHGKAESDIPQSDIEAAVLQIWKEVLNVGDLSTADGFFDGGGDSISAVIAAQRISEQLDCAVNTTTLFKYPNVKALSQYIAALKSVTPVDRPEPGTKDSARSAPIPKLSSPAVDPDYYRESAAIIGISCQFPGARDHREFWRNIRSGQESVRFFSPEELRALGLPDEIIGDPRYVPVQATIEDRDRFDPGFFNISPRDAEFMDPQFRLLLLHSWKAVEDAGYVSGQIPETAVFMSAGNHYDQNDPTAPSRAASRVFGDPDEYVAWILGQGGTIPTMISHKLGFTGPSFFIHSNCSSSLVGLYSAYRTLISGEAQYALVGGAALAPAPKLGYLHQSGLNFSGDGHVKTFDRAADGMVGGEGVAVILLKKAAVAIRDGDHIYALLRGIGVNNDGADKVGFYAPSVKGQAEVIRRVLDRTRVNPESIRYIEAHGTGTKLGDPIELTALSDTYRQYTKRKQFCGLGSVKTNIGHLDTAAGLAGCIKVALSLYHEEIPPSLNYQKPNPEFNLENSPFYVVDRLKVWEETGEPHRAALSSFGIGGTNAHAILERYARPAPEEAGAGQPGNKDVYLIPLSARNDERLKVYARELLDFLNSAARPDLANLAYTLQVGREAMDSRVIFVVNQYDELLDGLEQFIRGENRIAGCFRVAVKASRESGSLLENAEDWQALIQQWLAKGRLTKVAELWVQGLQMDWGLLHQGARLYRISLPTYPFARETYGFAPVAGQGAISADTIAPLHPLVHQNTSDFLEQRFRVTLTGWEFFLADHVLQGQKILPGVVYLEMARVAVILALGTAAPDTAGESGPPAVRLKNIVWVQPVIVNETPVEVNIRLFPEENGEITYEIYSGGSLEPVVHSQGVALLGPDTEAPAWDLEALKARCNRSALPATDFYQADLNTVRGCAAWRRSTRERAKYWRGCPCRRWPPTTGSHTSCTPG